MLPLTKVMTAATTKGIMAATMKKRLVERTRKDRIQAYTRPDSRAAAAMRKNWDVVTVAE